jgi:antitoxin component YwqK of YwqJK toxin-antitoxin module
MNKVDDKYLTYDDDLRTLHEGKPFTGIGIEYWPNGAKAAEMSYVYGIWDGPALVWHDDGTLKAEAFYKQGYLQGIAREWHQNGQLKREEEVDNAIELWSKEWDEHGNLVKEYTYTESPNYERLERNRLRPRYKDS